ncbi:3-hydroxybutyryl-CoA dehydrogenase [Streptosporangium becharense]|uniref:3-hydroxybutyryl-CoA dehydrogenase n=1 Tax=Streptosporangium becharense TaxID=1816182 RepID=A0A7W9IDG2_9ACTN|nr:3-hydroxybutyryl-CoA dehydrogenase [Streptosporangium becharense]MBB2913052.1 3-hydroxybutyryl-CoA dehydrogenase [Streptosporangium becharense]MBB5818123.1 3-hydroxybutyryl-CoA dehydrogenase [Streptosporangium becharense]
MSEIRRVGIVGCGVMGSGIADVCARAGLEVRVAVSGEASAARGRRRLSKSLDYGLRKAVITEAERDGALERVSFTTDLGDLADRQIVFETAPENESVKLDVFGALDKIVEDPAAILASNTSSIPIIRMARATGRPGQVIGVHFFNPVPVLPLVELIGSLLTEDETRVRAEAFVAVTLGKQVIHSPDRAGFVVNALLIPYLLAAIRMVETGFATADVIDQGMVLGCSHPMGPLKLADLIGLDTVASIAVALYEEFKDPQYSPPPMLLRMVEGGLLGRKTGRGFHSYS